MDRNLRCGSFRAGRVVLAAVVAAAGVVGGCGGGSVREAENPLNDALNSARRVDDRVAAVPKALSPALAVSERMEAKRQLEALLWSPKAEPELKIAILEALKSDPSPEIQRDAREQMRLLLPKQPSLSVTGYICGVAADNAWTEFVPAMVRSYARSVAGMGEEERPERKAIEKLSPGTSVERVAWNVFLNPPDEGETRRVRWKELYQADAWGLLHRLDPSGKTRDGFVREAQAAGIDNPVLAELQKCRERLRTVPATAEQLKWLRRLLDPKDAANAAWLEEAGKAIAGLEESKTAGLELRHAEPIRWASVHKPAWLAMSRETLLDELRQRLSGREAYVRKGDNRRGLGDIPEHLAEVEKSLGWADVLTVLVLDEEIRDPASVSSLFKYTEADRKDTTTEYGGVIEETRDGRPRVMLYPPWTGQRTGAGPFSADERFSASEDMIRGSDRALAHFHLHAKETSNTAFAGPSDEDLDYAATQGRSCIVVTSLSSKLLGVDYYQAGRVVVDLGTISLKSE